jgi:hypothetical protein
MGVMRGKFFLLAGLVMGLGFWLQSTAEARHCKSHYRHHHQPSFSIGFSFGSPSYHRYSRYRYPRSYCVPRSYHFPSYRYYQPRSVYYVPQRSYTTRTYYKPQVQRSPAIANAQKTLNELGYTAGPVDGLMGPKTRAAITQFQVASGIPASGQLDAKTRQWLAEYQ